MLPSLPTLNCESNLNLAEAKRWKETVGPMERGRTIDLISA
ncbi:hypothetical protein RISK_006154 [Rhodopirellula islandica]|uniref:Uncharacterized protein n=1 Tax=Rhodopirellula islandica TaxID=595434 RepID=A0A0J1B583_RHOIS|nr:hypothetical protein RISK_006154 [Rhodopirellula islandica]